MRCYGCAGRTVGTSSYVLGCILKASGAMVVLHLTLRIVSFTGLTAVLAVPAPAPANRYSHDLSLLVGLDLSPAPVGAPQCRLISDE